MYISNQAVYNLAVFQMFGYVLIGAEDEASELKRTHVRGPTGKKRERKGKELVWQAYLA